MSVRSANVIAVIALFMALSGSAYALKGKNSVNSGDIKNNSVRGTDIKKNTVQSSDLKDGGVKTADIKDGGIKGTDVKDNTLKGDQIKESSLVGLQGGEGETVMTGGLIDSLDTGTLAQTPAGVVELECGGAPTMRFINETGSDAVVLQTLRSIVLEDDGIANNGELGMGRSIVGPGGTQTSVVAGVGALGWGEIAVAAEGTSLIAEVRVFRSLDGCEYVGRVQHAPAG